MSHELFTGGGYWGIWVAIIAFMYVCSQFAANLVAVVVGVFTLLKWKSDRAEREIVKAEVKNEMNALLAHALEKFQERVDQRFDRVERKIDDIQRSQSA